MAEAGPLVNALEFGVLANLAVLVAGECLHDKVARIRCKHAMALAVTIAYGCRTDGIVMAVAGSEREPDGARTIDAPGGVFDAYGNPDSDPHVVISPPRANTVYTRNAEGVDTACGCGCRQCAEGKHNDAGGDDRNTAQHGRCSCK